MRGAGRIPKASPNTVTVAARPSSQSVGEGEEPKPAKALIADAGVEALDVRVLHELRRLEKGKRDATVSCPRLKGVAPELTAVVEGEPFRLAARPLSPMVLSGATITASLEW